MLAEGDRTESLRQLLPEQDLVQLGGIPILSEGFEDRFRVSLDGLLLPQGNGSGRLWGMDGVGGGRRPSRGLHLSVRGILGGDRPRMLRRLRGRRVVAESVAVGEGVGDEGVEGFESVRLSHCEVERMRLSVCGEGLLRGRWNETAAALYRRTRKRLRKS